MSLTVDEAASAALATAPMSLYDLRGERRGVCLCPDTEGATASAQLQAAARQAAASSELVFLFLPAAGLLVPELAQALADERERSGPPSGKLVVMLAGLGEARLSAGELQLLRAVGARIGIAELGAPTCGVSLLMTHKPEFVSISASLIDAMAEGGLAKVLVGGLMASCLEAEVLPMLPPGASGHALFWTRRLFSVFETEAEAEAEA